MRGNLTPSCVSLPESMQAPHEERLAFMDVKDDSELNWLEEGFKYRSFWVRVFKRQNEVLASWMREQKWKNEKEAATRHSIGLTESFFISCFSLTPISLIPSPPLLPAPHAPRKVLPKSANVWLSWFTSTPSLPDSIQRQALIFLSNSSNYNSYSSSNYPPTLNFNNILYNIDKDKTSPSLANLLLLTVTYQFNLAKKTLPLVSAHAKPTAILMNHLAPFLFCFLVATLIGE